MAELDHVTLMTDIAFKVTEDYEKFIFRTISPYCNQVVDQIIPKKLLSIALTTYKAEHSEEWNTIMEKYISHTEQQSSVEELDES